MHGRWARARARHRRLGLKPRDFLWGTLFAGIVAATALRARALTPGGAAVAIGVGAVTYGAGGWAFTLILLAFFLPSVGLSRVGRARKKVLSDIGKGGARDAAQVLANGGVATLCALIAGLCPETPARPRASAAWIAAFAGSYAAATADTWGTEIGVLARGKPYSILTLRRIPTGLSGGVTVAGTLAEAAGSAWIATAAALCLSLLSKPSGSRPTLAQTRRLIVPVFVAGTTGALVDSALGATLQELRLCPACDRTCETDPHACGTPTVHIRGLRGFSNDAVNLAATLAGALIAFASVARQ